MVEDDGMTDGRNGAGSRSNNILSHHDVQYLSSIEDVVLRACLLASRSVNLPSTSRKRMNAQQLRGLDS